MFVLLLWATLFAGFKKVVSIDSESMKKSYKATVVFPDTYRESEDRFSVVYLLHGYSGNHTSWPKTVPLKEYADRYQLIFVCPDAHRNSWYIDSPHKKNSDFQTYIAKEVPAFIEKTFRAKSETEGRALLGSSMGGHGALTILAEYPKLFCGASSVSGIMDLTEFPDQWEIKDVLGEYESTSSQWEEHSFISRASSLIDAGKAVSFGCGTEDFALPGNRKAHKLLMRYGIPHDYHERPGDHHWHYVRRNAEYHILFLSRVLEKPR